MSTCSHSTAPASPTSMAHAQGESPHEFCGAHRDICTDLEATTRSATGPSTPKDNFEILKQTFFVRYLLQIRIWPAYLRHKILACQRPSRSPKHCAGHETCPPSKMAAPAMTSPKMRMFFCLQRTLTTRCENVKRHQESAVARQKKRTCTHSIINLKGGRCITSSFAIAVPCSLLAFSPSASR